MVSHLWYVVKLSTKLERSTERKKKMKPETERESKYLKNPKEEIERGG